MRTKLTLPVTLSFTVLSSCAPSSQGDAGLPPTDGRTDVAEDRAIDALADIATDLAADVSVECAYNVAQQRFGLECRRRAGVPEGVSCPASVCVPSECPSATCQTCEYTFPCVSESDAGVACIAGGVCDPDSCPAGCRVT
jgi:hypothetical protein